MEETYYVRIRGKSYGPVNVDAIKKLIREGKAGRVNEISEDGANWERLGDVEKFFPKAPEPALPPPIPGLSSSAPTNGSGHDRTTVQWYYARDGYAHGPVDSHAIRDMLLERRLSPNDLVWKKGEEESRRASSIPEFAAVTPGVPHTILAGDESRSVVESGRSASVKNTLFCKHCGNEISSVAVFCVRCGAPTDNPSTTQGAAKTTVSGGIIAAGYAFAFLIPLVGFIMGIVILSKGEVTHGVFIMILSVAFFLIFFGALMQNAAVY